MNRQLYMKWPRWLRSLWRRKPKHGPPLAAALVMRGVYMDGVQQVEGPFPAELFADPDCRVFQYVRIVVRQSLGIEIENITDLPVRFQAVAFFDQPDHSSTVLPFCPVIIAPHQVERVVGRLLEPGLLRRILIPEHQ